MKQIQLKHQPKCLSHTAIKYAASFRLCQLSSVILWNGGEKTNKKVEEFLGFRTARSIPRQTPGRSEKEKNKISSITEAGSRPSSTLRMSSSRRFLNTTVPENGLNHTGASAITLFSSTIRPDRTLLLDDCGGSIKDDYSHISRSALLRIASCKRLTATLDPRQEVDWKRAHQQSVLSMSQIYQGA